jgi:hypothetical protein
VIDNAISELITQIKSKIASQIQAASSSFVAAFNSSAVLDFPPNNFPIGAGEIQLTYNFNQFGVSSSNRALISTSAKMTGVLDKPTWRIDRFYSPEIGAGGPGSFNNDQTLSINLYETALNGLLKTAWYAAWAQITAKPDTEYTDPILCTAVPGDACPFPPFRSQYKRTDIAPKGLAFNFLQSQFRRQGVFVRFDTNVVLKDPRVEITATGFEGFAAAVLFLQGKKGFLRNDLEDLLVLTVPVRMDVSTPSLNSDGTLGNFRINSFELYDFTFDYRVALPPRIDRRLMYRFVLQSANIFSAVFLTTLNAALDSALGNAFQLPFTSLPFGGLNLKLSVTNAQIQPVVGNESHLAIGATVAVSA